MGFFEAAYWCAGSNRPPISKICHTYPTMMKLSTVIPYLKKVQKIYQSRGISLGFCWHQHFFTGNQQSFLYQEIQIKIAFWYIISNSFNFFWIFKDCYNKHGYNFDGVTKKRLPQALLKQKYFEIKVMTLWFLSMTSPTKFYHMNQIILWMWSCD